MTINHRGWSLLAILCGAETGKLMNKLSDRTLGIILALIATVLGAAFMIPWKVATGLGQESDMVLILVITAAIFNSGTLGFQEGFLAILKKPSRLEVVISFLFAFLTLLGNQASAEAIRYLSPAVVTTIMRAEFIFISFMAWLFLGELIGKRFLLAIAIVMMGFYIMQPSFDIKGDWWIGAISATVAAFSFAAMAVITRRYVASINITRVNSFRLWLSFFLWFPIYRTSPNFEDWSFNFVFLVACAAILGPGLGRLLIMNAARFIEAKFSAILVASSPVFVLFLGALLLGTTPNFDEIIGGSIMIAGVLIALYPNSILRKKEQN